MNVFEFLITLTKRCTQCNEWGGGQWRGRGGQRPLIRATRRLTQHLWHHQQAHYLLLGDVHNTLCFCIVYLYIFKSYNCPNLNSDQYYEEKHVQHVQSWGWGCILRLSERSRSHWGGVKALSFPIHHQGHLSSGLCFLANLLRILQIEGGSAKGQVAMEPLRVDGVGPALTRGRLLPLLWSSLMPVMSLMPAGPNHPNCNFTFPDAQ